MTIQIKAAIVAVCSSLTLGVIAGASYFIQAEQVPEPRRERFAKTIAHSEQARSQAESSPSQGYKLFDQYCAQCHGDDARGDEGPNLHGLQKSDARLDTIIKGGVKGEMPAFAKKFTDSNVRDLITYLRTLQD
jgi:mono/diheme cytochrome c family protein